MTTNDSADMFLFAMRMFADDNMGQYQREHRFDAVRKWRFDYAWPSQRVAVEIDGGQWVRNGGRHNRDSDREKLNYAAAQGWRVLRFSTQQVDRDPAGCVELLRRALQCR